MNWIKLANEFLGTNETTTNVTQTTMRAILVEFQRFLDSQKNLPTIVE